MASGCPVCESLRGQLQQFRRLRNRQQPIRVLNEFLCSQILHFLIVPDNRLFVPEVCLSSPHGVPYAGRGPTGNKNTGWCGCRPGGGPNYLLASGIHGGSNGEMTPQASSLILTRRFGPLYSVRDAAFGAVMASMVSTLGLLRCPGGPLTDQCVPIVQGRVPQLAVSDRRLLWQSGFSLGRFPHLSPVRRAPARCCGPSSPGH